MRCPCFSTDNAVRPFCHSFSRRKKHNTSTLLRRGASLPPAAPAHCFSRAGLRCTADTHCCAVCAACRQHDSTSYGRGAQLFQVPVAVVRQKATAVRRVQPMPDLQEHAPKKPPPRPQRPFVHGARRAQCLQQKPLNQNLRTAPHLQKMLSDDRHLRLEGRPLTAMSTPRVDGLTDCCRFKIMTGLP